MTQQGFRERRNVRERSFRGIRFIDAYDAVRLLATVVTPDCYSRDELDSCRCFGWANDLSCRALSRPVSEVPFSAGDLVRIVARTGSHKFVIGSRDHLVKLSQAVRSH